MCIYSVHLIDQQSNKNILIFSYYSTSWIYNLTASARLLDVESMHGASECIIVISIIMGGV